MGVRVRVGPTKLRRELDRVENVLGLILARTCMHTHTLLVCILAYTFVHHACIRIPRLLCIRMYANAYVPKRMRTYTCLHIHTHAFMYIHRRAYLSMNTYTNVFIPACIKHVKHKNACLPRHARLNKDICIHVQTDMRAHAFPIAAVTHARIYILQHTWAY